MRCRQGDAGGTFVTVDHPVLTMRADPNIFGPAVRDRRPSRLDIHPIHHQGDPRDPLHPEQGGDLHRIFQLASSSGGLQLGRQGRYRRYRARSRDWQRDQGESEDLSGFRLWASDFRAGKGEERDSRVDECRFKR